MAHTNTYVYMQTTRAYVCVGGCVCVFCQVCYTHLLATCTRNTCAPAGNRSVWHVNLEKLR